MFPADTEIARAFGILRKFPLPHLLDPDVIAGPLVRWVLERDAYRTDAVRILLAMQTLASRHLKFADSREAETFFTQLTSRAPYSMSALTPYRIPLLSVGTGALSTRVSADVYNYAAATWGAEHPAEFSRLELAMEAPAIEDCAICMDPVLRLEFSMACRHVFHASCVRTWLRNKSSCPVCREPAVKLAPANPFEGSDCGAEVAGPVHSTHPMLAAMDVLSPPWHIPLYVSGTWGSPRTRTYSPRGSGDVPGLVLARGSRSRILRPPGVDDVEANDVAMAVTMTGVSPRRARELLQSAGGDIVTAVIDFDSVL